MSAFDVEKSAMLGDRAAVLRVISALRWYRAGVIRALQAYPEMVKFELEKTQEAAEDVLKEEDEP